MPGELESTVRIDFHARSHCAPAPLCRYSIASSSFVCSMAERAQQVTHARRKGGGASSLARRQQRSARAATAPAAHRSISLVFLNTTSFHFQRISTPCYFTNTFSSTFRPFRCFFPSSFRTLSLLLLGLPRSRSIGLMRQSNALFLSSEVPLCTVSFQTCLLRPTFRFSFFLPFLPLFLLHFSLHAPPLSWTYEQKHALCFSLPMRFNP